MTATSLAKRLRREWRANPKKVVTLGLLLAAALYSWTPLVGKWLAPTQPAGVPGVVEAASAGSPSPGVVETMAMKKTPTDNSGPPAYSWQQIVQWRQQDPHTVPAMHLTSLRDPFQATKARSAEAEIQKAKEVAVRKSVTPPWSQETLGLKVSSTVVGTRRSVALINGKAYAQEDTIELTKDGQTITLTLAEIHPGRIVLRWQDHRIELALPERESKGRFELLGSQ